MSTLQTFNAALNPCNDEIIKYLKIIYERNPS